MWCSRRRRFRPHSYNCSFGGSTSEQRGVQLRGDWVTERQTWWPLVLVCVCVWLSERFREFTCADPRNTKKKSHGSKVMSASKRTA